MLEFSIAMVAALIVISGTISFGRLFFEEQMLVEAVHAGSRMAAVQPRGILPEVITSRVQATVTDFIQRSGGNPAQYALRISPLDIPFGEAGNAPAVRLSITRLSSGVTTFGATYFSTPCFSSITVMEKTNTVLQVEQPGGTEC